MAYKNRGNLYIILSILLILSINMVSANQYFEYQKFLPNNKTIEKFGAMTYQTGDYDNIKAGNSFQYYIWYHANIEDWNTKNLNNTVSYCSLKVQISKGVSLLGSSVNVTANTTPVTIFNQNFTENIQDGKYFVTMDSLDSSYIFLDCVFTNPSTRPNLLIMPMDFSVVTPTYECKACQFYDWATDEIKVNKAKTLGEYTTTNLTYIERLFGIFYELFVVGFWIILILILVLALGLIFFLLTWLFKYLYKHTNK